MLGKVFKTPHWQFLALQFQTVIRSNITTI
jgi:hypothetical protein